MCAATGAGLFADLKTAAQTMANTGAEFEPRPIQNIDQFYQRWRAAYQGLADLTLT
jgi:ribulose kinase